MEKTAPSSVDEYLSAVPVDAFRNSLQRLREIIREEAPEAQECISYGMPGYKLNGYLIGFAAFKNHCSLFPGGTAMNFVDKLNGFKMAKGTIQFTPARPIPEDLIREIVRARIADNSARRKG